LTIATGGGVGLLPIAPGTFGSLVGVFVFTLVAPLGLVPYLACFVVISLVGVWASDRAEEIFRRADDGRIVIDEVAGQLLTLVPLVALRGFLPPPHSSQQTIGGVDLFFSLVVTGFVVFRVLDVWKPGMVRWAEENVSGGFGVMADDLLAGALGAVLLAAITLAALMFSQAAAG
jgi:phosphatidylglycerophosphatase A